MFRGAGDRPFLISGADDRTAKVWDYQTKACVQVRRERTVQPPAAFACGAHPVQMLRYFVCAAVCNL